LQKQLLFYLFLLGVAFLVCFCFSTYGLWAAPKNNNSSCQLRLALAFVFSTVGYGRSKKTKAIPSRFSLALNLKPWCVASGHTPQQHAYANTKRLYSIY
jgi:hypothetical protein